MVQTKTLEQTNKAWREAQGRVPAAYQSGIDATQDFVNKAIAGKDNYVAGIQDAIAKGKREEGLGKISDSDWKQAAKVKGAARIAAGMKAAEADYSEGMQKNLAVIQSVNIPPRVQSGDANINARLKPIAKALAESAGNTF